MNTITQYFLSISESAFCVCVTSDAFLCDSLWALESDSGRRLVVRICRGSKISNDQGLFDEFAAAFQFPYYFGNNWPALKDCLSELSWIPADAYLVCVMHADLLLADDCRGLFETLVHTLQRIAHGWSRDSHNLAVMGRKPTPFHILFQASAAGHDLLSARLTAIGVKAKKIDFC